MIKIDLIPLASVKKDIKIYINKVAPLFKFSAQRDILSKIINVKVNNIILNINNPVNFPSYIHYLWG